MILGRVLLSLRTTCSRSVCFQKICAGNERSIPRLHHIYISYCPYVNVRIILKAIAQVTVSDMQPASISYGKETTAVATDGDDDEGGGGNEDVERGAEVEELRKMMIMTVGQVDAGSMEVQQVVTDTGASTLSAPTGSSEKQTRRKMRREKRKLIKRKLKSAETSNSLMSELPFALTSPTAWKELGFSSQESTQKKRKRKRGDSGGRVDSEEDADKKKKKKESQRPNYFVSIPITNTQISSAVIEVQEAVLQQEPRLAKAMIPVPTLHITLLVTHLANQEQVDL